MSGAVRGPSQRVTLVGVLALALVVSLAAPPALVHAEEDAAALRFACPDPLPGGGFGDVSSSNVHARAIDCLVAFGITEGLSDSRYGPSANVTRAQLATFVGRMFQAIGEPLPVPASTQFRDVSGVHADSIEALAAAGIVQGTSSGTYSPGADVTRAQMASFLDRALRHVGFELDSATAPFADVSGVHAPAVGALFGAGVVQGTSATTYAPSRPVTRAAMAAFLMRSMDLLVQAGLTQPPYVDGGNDAGSGDGGETQFASVTGSCAPLENLLEGSGQLSGSGDMVIHRLELVENRLIVLRPRGFDRGVRWRLVDDVREIVAMPSTRYSEPGPYYLRPERTETYRLEIFTQGSSAADFAFEIYEPNRPGCDYEVAGIPAQVSTDAAPEGSGLTRRPGEINRYSLPLEAGRTYVFRPQGFESQMRWGLYDRRGDAVFAETGQYSTPSDQLVRVDATATYSVQTRGYGTGWGQYGFEIYDATEPFLTHTVAEFPFEVFADNPFPGAGRITRPGHYHDFELSLSEGQRVSFVPRDFGRNLRWLLLDPDGDRVFSNTGRYSDVETQYHVAQTAGTYRLRVIGYDTGTGSYNFELRDVTEPIIDVEVTSFPFEAFANHPEEGVGRIARPGDRHQFRMELEAGQRVALEPRSFDRTLRWGMLGPDGVVFNVSGQYSSVEGRVETIQTSGSYRLVVYGYGSVSTGRYEFDLDVID